MPAPRGDDAARSRGQRPEPPKARACSFCGWTENEYWLRVGDDRRLHEVGGEVICSLCATPADVGSRRHARPEERS